MLGYVHIKPPAEKEGEWYCCDCKNWLDDLKAERECMGEFWGMPAYDTFYYCPICGSDCIVGADEVIIDDEDEDLED